MRASSFRFRIIAICTLFCINAVAQDLSRFAANAPWLQSFFVQLNPSTPEFSANGTMTICDLQGAPRMILPMDLQVSSNSLRWDLDVQKMPTLPQQTRDTLKNMHMDKVVFVTKVDEKRIYAIYPAFEAYVTMPIPDSSLAELSARKDLFHIEKTEIGEEIAANHPCVKAKIVALEPNQPSQEGLAWSATDLHGFPVKMELRVTRGIMKFEFPDVRIEKPAASAFDFAKNYAGFTNSVDLMNYIKEKLQNTAR